jgi:hypothetical protein
MEGIFDLPMSANGVEEDGSIVGEGGDEKAVGGGGGLTDAPGGTQTDNRP